MKTLSTTVEVNGKKVLFDTPRPGLVGVAFVNANREPDEYSMSGEDAWQNSLVVAVQIYGPRKRNLRNDKTVYPNCTNSEMHDIYRLMLDIAGC